jgi:hypothetical protein
MTATLSTQKKRNLAYKLHLLTYLDILGFRELVKTKSPNFISHVIGRAIEWTSPDEIDRKDFQENYVNFSDLIVRAIPLESRSNLKLPYGAVYYEIKSLATAQAVLAVDEGVLLRGALVVGQLERTYKVLFGPALIAAYDLERDYARYPRIVIAPELFSSLKSNPLLRFHDYDEEMKYIAPLIKRDDDGFVFIDYLAAWKEVVDSEESYLEFLKSHKKLVENRINEFQNDGRILPKYLWLRKYHDATVRSQVTENRREECSVKVEDITPEIPNLI